MDFDGCISLIQSYLQNSPLIVLGSGASMPYGLPSMRALAEKIKGDPVIASDSNYNKFCDTIDIYGLEGAIDTVQLSSNTLDTIRQVTWNEVNYYDLKFFSENPITPPKALADLLSKVISPTPNKAVIVTTNYDRLSEYAADSIGATVVTGFEGSLIRKLELSTQSVKNKRTRVRERVVDIWKVHGSLDWFKNTDNDIVSFPFSKSVPNDFQPLIVPPGKEKYSSTHYDPYRTIIAEADKAFVQANAYICVGYGFNDEHIQPKLLAQIAKGKPIVVLAKTVTESCKKHIIDAGVSKYLIFEEADNAHTKVHGNGWCQVYDGQYWLLDEFLRIW